MAMLWLDAVLRREGGGSLTSIDIGLVTYITYVRNSVDVDL